MDKLDAVRPHDSMSRLRIALIYYSAFSSFIKNDYDILSRHFDVFKFNIQSAKDILSLMAAISKSDLSFIWFAGEHSFPAILLSKALGKKSIIVAGGYDVAYEPEIGYGQFTLGWNKRMYTKFSLKYADKVLVVDPSLREDAIRNAGVSGENIRYLPTGYDSDKFKPKGFKENLVVTLGYISNSSVKRKGLDTFVKAASYIPEAKFALIGKPQDDAIEALKRCASNNVEFTGYLPNDDLLKYLQRAKVYCQLSAYEGLPNALCEAMLCECVPVGTKRKGIPTAIGDTGFYVEYGDTVATANAIKRGLTSPVELGQKARERIMSLFPIERRELGLVQAITDLCKIM
jgi:glycosyltransferase involved in cell wall biosynthesis